MRKILFPLFSLFSVLCFVACSDDKTEPELTFPETQLINCTTGETHTLSFNAPASWKLSSTASWCKFVTDGGTQLSLAGEAGDQTIKLSISDEGIANEGSSTAQLNLFMQGQQGVLAQITRSAAGYSLKVYDAEGNESDVITVGYNEYATFYVKANFPFAVTTMPEWAELRGASLVGAANEMTESGIRSTGKNECSGTILFQDMHGKAAFNIPVVYHGMSRDAIEISQPEGNPWNWIVSANGQTWTHSGNTYGNHVLCTINAYNDAYEVVYVEEKDKQFIVGEAQWLHLNKSTGLITVDATETVRTGYIFAFPQAVYEQIKNNLASALVGEDGLAYNYLQNNLVICVKQQEAKGDDPFISDEVGFIAISFDENWEMVETECYRITDKETLDHCAEVLNTREVFLLDYYSTRYGGGFDQIKPYPLISSYDDWDPELCYFADYNGTRITDEEPEAGYDDSSSPNYWYVMGCHNTETPMFLVLQNKDHSVMKALLIHTKSL